MGRGEVEAKKAAGVRNKMNMVCIIFRNPVLDDKYICIYTVHCHFIIKICFSKYVGTISYISYIRWCLKKTRENTCMHFDL